jgi:hypothetical protein
LALFVTKSDDYHDYVFRDGELVGAFEEMYRNSTTVPWHQDEQESWLDVRLTKELLRDSGQVDEIHDLGCGTGHYMHLMAQDLLVPGGTGYGYDISETACSRAALNFPSWSFSVLDLTQESGVSKTDGTDAPGRGQDARLYMLRGTLWYVFPKLSTVIRNIRCMMDQDDDRLLVVQNFPPLDTKFIGKEIIPHHFALIAHFKENFVLQRHIWYENSGANVNDNWFIGVFSPSNTYPEI